MFDLLKCTSMDLLKLRTNYQKIWSRNLLFLPVSVQYSPPPPPWKFQNQRSLQERIWFQHHFKHKYSLRIAIASWRLSNWFERNMVKVWRSNILFVFHSSSSYLVSTLLLISLLHTIIMYLKLGQVPGVLMLIYHT